MQKILKEMWAGTSEAPLASLPILADNHHVHPAWRTLKRWIHVQDQGRLLAAWHRGWKKAKSFKALNEDPVSLISSADRASLPDSVHTSGRQTKCQSLSWCWCHSPETIPTRPGHQYIQGQKLLNGNFMETSGSMSSLYSALLGYGWTWSNF